MDKDLEDSVVAVYSKSDGQEVFAGSAFFVSPRHLLTARHVVYDRDLGKCRPELYLRLIHGHAKWEVPEGDITYYDEDGTVDVAMITLSSNVDGQHHLDMSKIRHGVQGEPVDICGIDKENEARAPRNDHTLSTYDPAIEAWRLDHQVRGGYSGGLVATGNTPLGIVFRRHKVDQVTLIFPLTSLREWIEKDTPSVVS